MAKILVLYYSVYGHIEAMADAVAEGARSVAGVEVAVKRVPHIVPEDVLRQSGAKFDQPAPVATVDELAGYDAILFGTPTRFGNMAGAMRHFLDQTGQLWLKGALIGKVGSVFVSSATQHGGQDSTILTSHVTLLHQGMVIVGLPYSAREQMTTAEITGGSPYGATTIAGGDGSRKPSQNELTLAPFQGRPVANAISSSASSSLCTSAPRKQASSERETRM